MHDQERKLKPLEGHLKIFVKRVTIQELLFFRTTMTLKSCNALDYHDCISCSVKLLTDFPEVLAECQESWKGIVIDEFKDTNTMQYGLLQILASHKCITVVGDEDQSIFSFNGADACGFDSFRKYFPMYKEVRVGLNKNYRSTCCTVDAASFLIRNNLKLMHFKDVVTDNSSWSKITIKDCSSWLIKYWHQMVHPSKKLL